MGWAALLGVLRRPAGRGAGSTRQGPLIRGARGVELKVHRPHPIRRIGNRDPGHGADARTFATPARRLPTETPGFSYTPIEMELVSPERQFQVFIDNVRLPADALVGSEDAAIAQLFAGLNPERIMGAANAVGMGRFAINKAVDYVKTRQVWKTPIGAHQGLSHPLAQNYIEVELAKLMMQKAATLYDSGDDAGAAEAANIAKYAAGEASARAVDQAVQSLGGNGLTKEYGIAAAMTLSRLARIAPVSREMVLNFVAQTSLGLPRSY
jgi:alkylation response protein AidB-like acyl-CoA dehydrogenase